MTNLPHNELTDMNSHQTSMNEATGSAPVRGVSDKRKYGKHSPFSCQKSPVSCCPSSCDHGHSAINAELHQQEYRPSNEYVLNVAFVSFLGFTMLQNVFALVAHSQSMMADCAAMYVDVVTYLFNFLAERLKHGNSAMSSRQLRLRRLYLELIPPSISVATLVGVTVMALREAVRSLTSVVPVATDPNINMMLLFSGLNLLLDLLNVGCFARVDQAVGLPSSFQPSHSHAHHHEGECEGDCGEVSHSHRLKKEGSVATEATPLVSSDDEQSRSVSSRDSDLDESIDSKDATGILNLNMCSAWTHICADTLRSVAVLVAAGLAYLLPWLVSPVQADAWGAIVVSVIILISLLPLLQGLYQTLGKIRAVWSSSCSSSSHEGQDSVYLVV